MPKNSKAYEHESAYSGKAKSPTFPRDKAIGAKKAMNLQPPFKRATTRKP